ncbi:aldehyde dehydrogenase (NADP(+)) [Acidovorax sp. LjRoot194]|uniref:aldehyde dehydrogenase (NADP(+)) n=1 Tax=Acidovorax sp. LjRoot194 TaxID=3342280 RepID=UPI003ED0A816
MNDIDHLLKTATAAAAHAAPFWAKSAASTRATLLSELAAMLEHSREELVQLAHSETHLGAARLNGELDRTCYQLREFAAYASSGAISPREEDEAVAGPAPRGRPHMARILVPLGPVAMFSASNFPFAFSVLGGDTASALASGCPVIVRAHPAHTALSESVFRGAQQVLKSLNLPMGVLGMVTGDSLQIGATLVNDSVIKAIAFTGSTGGGLALEALACARKPPVPFFGELGSVNPLVILPRALSGRVEELASQLAGSVSMGMGQFCTRPGLIALHDDNDAEQFVAELEKALESAPIHAMLTPGIEEAFNAAASDMGRCEGARLVMAPTSARPSPLLMLVNADDFLAQPRLHEEIFGPAAIVVLCKDIGQLGRTVRAVAGSLTVTLWGADTESPAAKDLVSIATECAGRVLFGGVPTGVAVTRVQHHGGPWPASTRPSSTSVGLHACERFLRPVVYQNAPTWVLPAT